MARYLPLALNGPADDDGDAEALERWYEEVHLPAFKAIPEIRSARRYKVLRGKVPGLDALWPNVAAYKIETDDMAALSARMQRELMNVHPALDRERSANLMCIRISGDA